MSNNVNRELKDKIDSVTPLQSGIVFGKEEAWDKLQARMDKKPARVMALPYRLAAAAVLLLMAGAITFYYTTATNPATQQEAITVAHEATHGTGNQPVQTTPVAIITHITDITTTKSIITANVKNNRTKQMQLTAIPVQNLIPQVPQQLPAEPVMITAIPVAKAKVKMKVLHLSDLDKTETTQNALVQNEDGAIAPSLANGKMRTLHINDVIKADKQEQYTRSYKLSISNGISFMKLQQAPQEAPAATDESFPQRTFKINLSAQN